MPASSANKITSATRNTKLVVCNQAWWYGAPSNRGTADRSPEVSLEAT